MRKLQVLLIAVLSLGALLVHGPAGATGTLDQSQTVVDSQRLRVCDAHSAGQTFKAGRTGGLDQVDLLLTRQDSPSGASPGPLTVEIRTAADGVPTSETALATATLAPEDVAEGSVGAWLSVPLAPPAAVTTGAQYAIVLSTTSTPGGGCSGSAAQYFARGTFSNPYGDGTAVVKNPSHPSWGAIPSEDLAFQTYVDETAPAITITTPADGGTYSQGETVLAEFSCDDGEGSGVASCAGPVANGSAIDTSTLGSHEFTVTATDNAGNTASLTNTYTVVDSTDPTITITTPADGATYTQGQTVLADYSCSDDGSGIASCTGPVPDGDPIDTSTLGSHTFTVTATDNAGNTDSMTVSYTVVRPTPKSKDDCKNGGWTNFVDDNGEPFKSQGDCVSYVASNGKSK